MRTFVGLFRNLSLWMLVALLSLGTSQRCYADPDSASISATVTDPSGAVVPSARVVIRNVATNQEQRAESSQNGTIRFPFLKPGQYTLLVNKDGFAEIAVNNIVLNVGDEKSVRVVLHVGSANQNVEVDGSRLTINTSDAAVSTVVDRQFVENMPLNGRSFQSLIALTPGVVTQSPQAGSSLGNNGDFSVNGQRTESNAYIVDGVSQNSNPGAAGGLGAGTGGSLGAGTALGTTQSLVSVDALQEFRVTTSTYSAEYGRTPGGQFSLETRSGTNIPHGTVFDYLRNDAFDANDWFNDHLGAPKTALRQNDFGGTFGAPVWLGKLYNGKDRTFFFASYEGLRLTSPQPASLQYVPSLSLRATGAAALQPILNSFPIPTGPEIHSPCDGVAVLCPVGQPVGTSVPSGLSPFVKSYSLPGKIDATSLRIDQLITPRLHAFVRAAYTPTSSNGRTLATPLLNSNNLQTYTAGVTAQISSRFSNDLRLGYTKGLWKTVQSNDEFGGATPINQAQALGLGAYPAAETYFSATIPNINTINTSDSNSTNYQRQWNIVDTVALQRGTHSIKIGVDYRRVSSPLTLPNPIGELFYTDRSDVESNNNSAEIIKQLSPAPLYNELALFIQDEWRATPRLTISAGLRWELNPPPTSQNNLKPQRLLGNVNQPATLALDLSGKPVYDTQYDALAPRVGIAWKVNTNANSETVIRAGAGLFYDTGTSGSYTLFLSPASTASVAYTDSSVPFTSSQLAFTPSATPPYSGFTYAVSPSLRLPYTIQWNAALEQSLGKDQTVTISYVGSNGNSLIGQSLLNAGAINPSFSIIDFYSNQLSSNYQSLQMQYRQQLAHGLQALASYTWSHAIDYGSSDTAFGYKRGNADFDLRNNASGAVSWEIPTHSENAIVKSLISYWALDGRFTVRTSFPVNLTGTSYFAPSTGLYMTNQLNLNPGVPIYIHGNYPGGRTINAAAFKAAPKNTQGNSPRNFTRGFGAGQVDLAVRREFPVGDHLHMQFRAETFNLTNHPNFGFVDHTLNTAQFGQATQSLSQSLSTENALYQQGGPRSMQFALKLRF